MRAKLVGTGFSRFERRSSGVRQCRLSRQGWSVLSGVGKWRACSAGAFPEKCPTLGARRNQLGDDKEALASAGVRARIVSVLGRKPRP